jgi:hypothetical protein
MAAQIQQSLSPPTKTSEPALTEGEAHRNVAAEPKKPELAQTTSKEDESASATEAVKEKAPSTLEQATSQVSGVFESVTSKVSSALSPEEPLVSKTAPGSTDAPGAFPASGSDLDSEAGVKGTSLGQKQPEDSSIDAPTEERKTSETTA